jgi:methionine-rich copper-binding protein CopC
MKGHSNSDRLRTVVSLVILVATFATPASVFAHSELETATPPDGAVLSAPPPEIVLTFSAPLNPSKSSITLRDPSGMQIATGGVDPDDDTVMRLTPPGLEPGTYEIRWTSVAEDGDLLRDTLHFELTEPVTPTPTPTPSPSAARSAVPSLSPSPVASATLAPSPSPSGAGAPTATTTDVLLPILAAIAVIVLLGAWLLRNRSRGTRP